MAYGARAAADAFGQFVATNRLSQGQKISASEDPGRTRRGAKGRTGVSRGYANSQQKIQDVLARQAAAHQAQMQAMLAKQQKIFEDATKQWKQHKYDGTDKWCRGNIKWPFT